MIFDDRVELISPGCLPNHLSAFDSLKKRFLNILAMHGGKLDHSTLLRNLSVDATLFKRLVVTLKMYELIEDEEITGGKLGYIISVAD